MRPANCLKQTCIGFELFIQAEFIYELIYVSQMFVLWPLQAGHFLHGEDGRKPVDSNHEGNKSGFPRQARE
jgi:hypothetical protein